MLSYFLSFVSGFLVKAVDWLDDNKKSKSPIKYLLSGTYGILIGYLISVASFSTLFLGALVAQAVARKIDTDAHVLGAAISVLSIFFFGFPSIELLSFGIFFVLAYLDELQFPEQFSWISEWRILLKLGAAFFLIFGRWDYLIAILAFDVGYEVFSFISRFLR